MGRDPKTGLWHMTGDWERPRPGDKIKVATQGGRKLELIEAEPFLRSRHPHLWTEEPLDASEALSASLATTPPPPAHRLYTRVWRQVHANTSITILFMQPPATGYYVVLRTCNISGTDLLGNIGQTFIADYRTLPTPTTTVVCAFHAVPFTTDKTRYATWSGTLVMPPHSYLVFQARFGTCDTIVGGWLLQWPAGFTPTVPSLTP